MIFPVKDICAGLAELGVDTIIDGAHAPGMLPLAIDEIGAAWYTGNCHKWMCGPKTAGFLATAPGRLGEIEPLITSFGSSFQETGKHPRQWEFFWRGTHDASAFFVLPELIDFMAGLLPGGWPEIMERNHRLVMKGQDILCDALQIDAPLPESMIGSMATLPLPDHGRGAPRGLFREDCLGHILYEDHKIEVPLMQWPRQGEFKIRISAQLYNSVEEYEALAKALLSELPAVSG
jgi:isopenicillin-N epimerase